MMILRLFTVVLVLSIPAFAAARSATVRLVHRGDCPTAQELRAALREVGVKLGGGRDVRWVVDVTARRGEALTIALRRAGQQQMSWKRSLRNRDCTVLAKAAAIILRAHFISLGIAMPAPSATPRAGRARGPRQAGSTAVVVAPSTPPAAPRKRRGDVEPELQAHKAAAPRSWRPQLAVGLSGGINLAADPQLTSAVAQLDLGFRFSRFPLATRLVFNAGSPTTQANLGQEVRLQQLALRLDLLVPFRFGDLRLTPGAGAGVELLHVWAKDVEPDETHLRGRPYLALTIGLGYQLSEAFMLRLESTAQVTPSADDYLVSGRRVARSPRFAGMLTLGLVFAFPRGRP